VRFGMLWGMRAGRAVASIMLAGAVVLGTSACSFFTPQATLFHYDPANGVGTSVGSIDVRDAVAIINDDGDAISLIITFVNRSADAVANIVVQFQSDGEKTDAVVNVGGYGVTQFGTTPDQTQIVIAKPDVVAGQLLPVYVQYGDEQGKTILVPVLDGTLPEYADLLPVKPTPTPTPTPTEAPTPEATEAPAEG
jgi:hypothetical protein